MGNMAEEDVEEDVINIQLLLDYEVKIKPELHRKSFGKLLFLLILLNCFFSYSQNEEPDFFSVAIDRNIRSFNQKAEKAFLQNDMDRVDFLFDSLVKYVIKGTQLDNFVLTKKSGRKIRLHTFRKPLFIITYSTWYPLKEGEIQAFNQIAKEYSKDIDFIALFWETQVKTIMASRDFSRKVNVLYADEKENQSDNIIKTMKHSLGVPTAIFTNTDKIILDVGRLPAYNFHNVPEASFQNKYDYFLQGVNTILNPK